MASCDGCFACQSVETPQDGAVLLGTKAFCQGRSNYPPYLAFTSSQSPQGCKTLLLSTSAAAAAAVQRPCTGFKAWSKVKLPTQRSSPACETCLPLPRVCCASALKERQTRGVFRIPFPQASNSAAHKVGCRGDKPSVFSSAAPLAALALYFVVTLVMVSTGALLCNFLTAGQSPQ